MTTVRRRTEHVPRSAAPAGDAASSPPPSSGATSAATAARIDRPRRRRAARARGALRRRDRAATRRASSTATRLLTPPSLAPIGGHVLPARHRHGRPRHAVAPDPRHAPVAGRSALVSVGLSLIGGVAARPARRLLPRRASSIAIMRLMDIMLALPSLLLAVAVVADPRARAWPTRCTRSPSCMLPHFVRLTRGAVLGELAKRLRHGLAHGRRRHAAADVRHRAAELRRAADRPGDARLLVGDPRRRGARLPRPRRAAADARVGLDARRARSSSSRARGGS